MTEGILGGSFAKDVVKRLGEVAKDRGQKVAAQWGEPLDGQKPTRQQIVELWNWRNPASLTPEGQMMVQQMLAQGQHAAAVDVVFPYRNRLIGRGDINTRIERAGQLNDMAMKAMAEEVMGL